MLTELWLNLCKIKNMEAVSCPFTPPQSAMCQIALISDLIMAAGGNADVCAKTSFKLKFSRASLWSSWRSLSFRPLWQLQLVRLQVSMAIQAVLSVRTFPRAQSLQNFVPLFFWWSYLWLWLALRWFWCWRRLINPMHQRSLMTSGFCMLLHTLRLPSFKQHHWNLKRTPWDGRQTLFLSACLIFLLSSR